MALQLAGSADAAGRASFMGVEATQPHRTPGSERPWAWFNALLSSRASLIAQLVKGSACNVGDLASIPGLGRYKAHKATRPVRQRTEPTL